MSWRDRLRPSIAALGLYRTFDYRPGLIRMDANESPFSLDEADRATIRHELDRLPIHRYPDVSGRPLREVLARRWNVSPEMVIVGNGSDEILSMLYTAFAEGPRGRGKALFPVPTFGEYESIALSHGADPVKVPLDAEWQVDEARCLEAIDRERPVLAFFASPNNPTGNRFDEGVLERLARVFPGVFVVDEAYGDFGGSTMATRVGEIEGFCVMRSLSKIGLAGLRLGALLGPQDLVAQIDKVRLPFNVNAVSMALACALLENPGRLEDRVRRVAAARRELGEGLARIDRLKVWPSDANFVLVRTPIDATTVWKRLVDRGVLVRDVSGPGPLRNALRITAGTSEENARCLEALAAAIA